MLFEPRECNENLAENLKQVSIFYRKGVLSEPPEFYEHTADIIQNNRYIVYILYAFRASGLNIDTF